MALIDFQNLLEIQSLELLQKKHIDKIEENNRRLTHITKLRAQKVESIVELNKNLAIEKELMANDEKELFIAEQKLSNTKEHLPMATSEKEVNALEKEIATLTPLIETLENTGLELLEKIELIEIEIKEGEEFLIGSKETYDEVKLEVDTENLVEEKELQNYQKRIDLIVPEIEKIFWTSYQDSSKDHKYKNPLTFLVQGKCQSCKFHIDTTSEKGIEAGNTTELCSGCSRLLTTLAVRSL